MRKRNYFNKILFSLILLVGLVSCKKVNPVIIVKPEPFYKEVSDEVFDKSEVYEYLTFEDGNGKKIDFDEVFINGVVDLTTIGTYPLEIIGKYKNKTTEAEISVLVLDRIAPVFNIVDEKEIVILQNSNFDLKASYYLISAFDSYDGLLTDRINIEGSVDTAVNGEYPVIYTVSDSSGNNTSRKVIFRVVKDNTDLIDYLYKETLDLYWGKLFIKDENNKIILNFEDIIENHFTSNFQKNYKNLIGLNGKLNSNQSPLHIYYDNNKIIFEHSEHEKINNYMYSKLQVVTTKDNYIKAEVSATYGKNQIVEKTIESIFELRLVDGQWLVDNFTLPN